MTPRRALFLLLSAAALVPMHLRAELKFESSELSIKAKLGEKSVTAEFKFKNTGNSEVSITRVHSSCGCTVPEKPSKEIAPGASGVIPVTYRPGERQGLQSQQVEVETSDGKIHLLRLSVDVPVRVVFSPRLLLFRGDDAGPKTAVLTFGEEVKPELLGVSTQSPAFEILGEPALEGRILKLTLRHIGPADADARASVRVRTRDATGEERTDILYARHSVK